MFRKAAAISMKKKYLIIILTPVLMLVGFAAGLFTGKAVYDKDEISFYGVIIQKVENENQEIIQFIVEGIPENDINHRGKFFLSEPGRKGAVRDKNGNPIGFSDLEVGYFVQITYDSDKPILDISPSIIEGGVNSILVVDEEYGRNQLPELVLRTPPDDGSHFSMIIKEGTVTPTGATIIMVNKTNEQAMYGQPFGIDQKVGNEWVELAPVIQNYAFTMEAFIIPPGRFREMEVNWEWLYGSLDTGRYRIVKNMRTEPKDGTGYEATLTVEFEIP